MPPAVYTGVGFPEGAGVMTMKYARAIHGWFVVARLVAATWPCLPSTHAASPVVISEFMARNSSGLADDDLERSDWIELRNISDQPVNLGGWFLTDRRNRDRLWRLPATNLVARGHLVVFASAKNRGVAGRPLHTNFRLDADGGYLALLMPDGASVATEFSPAYPRQFDDTSYGTGLDVVTTRLVARGDAIRYRIPADASLGTRWRERDFDDTAWAAGRTGLGFASGTALSAGGLYAYWPVREGSGGTVTNLAAGGTHGILHGASWTNDPIRGTALDFNGRSSYVSAGTIPRMGVTNHFTWSFWYRQRSVPNLNAVILGNRSGGAAGSLQFIKFTPSNFEYYHDGNIGFIPHLVPAGSWRHLAVVKDGPALTYYDNGTVVGTSRAGGDVDPNPFYWGGDPGAPGEYVDGLIDDVSLWNRALAPDEIRALLAGTSPASMSGLAGFVATDIGRSMQGVNAGAYLRIPFAAPDGADFDALRLSLLYNDGFVAYLNGVEVARRHAPAAIAWDSSATASHPVGAATAFEPFDLPAAPGLVSGALNVLAIHGLNRSAADPDFLVLPELEATRETSLGLRYFESPTPGTANDAGVLGFVEDTQFDQPRGFRDAPFTVALSCATPGATIRYTTDGTQPSADHGIVYVAPLNIRGTTILRAAAFRPGFRTPRTGARSYLFLEQILTQTGAGLPNNWGNDWQMDPRVVTSPAYAGRIRDDMKSLPVVSLALDPVGFWGAAGIYTLSTGRGDDYERPGSAEMFFPDGSAPGFDINCGIQIVGGASRTMTPKHGIGLTFKSRYGPPKLKYRFFDNSPVDEFDFLAFRPNFNMSWVRTDNSGPLNNANADGAERLHAIYVRDQFTKESQLAMGQPAAHERFVHLYINGVYWGLYNPSERTDASFAASYFGGDKEDYDAIFSDSNTIARAHDGDKNAWLDMMKLARQGLTSSDAYARIQQVLDVTNLADYMMLNFYCATVDWPWQNWNAVRKRADGARFRFFIWDAEYTLETPPWVPDDRTGVGPGSGEADSPARLYHELRSNAEWRLLFADRVQQHCFNGGALTTNQTIPRFLRLCDTIDGAIVGESARWGDVVRRNQPYTRDVEWLAEKNRLLTQFFPQRTGRLIQQFIQADLYPNLPAPSLSHAGGVVTSPFQLALTAPSGSIYYTTNGLDPRLPGGQIAPGARLYDAPVAIAGTGARQVQVRTLRNNTWSALTTAVFTLTTTEPPPGPAPTLTATIRNGAVVISWPSSAIGYVLETAGDLASPQWHLVPGTETGTATLPITEGGHFYRLRKP